MDNFTQEPVCDRRLSPLPGTRSNTKQAKLNIFMQSSCIQKKQTKKVDTCDVPVKICSATLSCVCQAKYNKIGDSTANITLNRFPLNLIIKFDLHTFAGYKIESTPPPPPNVHLKTVGSNTGKLIHRWKGNLSDRSNL